jgi:hypothetical protein
MTPYRLAIFALLCLLYPLLVAWQVAEHTPPLVQCGLSSVFLAEYHAQATILADAGYWKMRDFAGLYYHFKDGERVVTGGSRSARYTLWLFGNSGLMDPWLADADTAATRLQALLPAYRVRNRSASAQAIAGQLAWLRETPVGAGDLVVFVDGVSDRNTPNVLALIAAAKAYTQARGGAFWHFRQPYVGANAYIAHMPGLSLTVPDAHFIEGAHMDAYGAAIEAQQIYRELTTY